MMSVTNTANCRPRSKSMLEKNLSERAREEMGLWFRTLSYEDRRKLEMHRSPWGRSGGNIISVGLRRGKTARRNKKLKREREARLKAEQAAYEVRRGLPASMPTLPCSRAILRHVTAGRTQAAMPG